MEFVADCAICNVDPKSVRGHDYKRETRLFDSSLKAVLWLANHCVTEHAHGDTITFHGFVTRTKS